MTTGFMQRFQGKTKQALGFFDTLIVGSLFVGADNTGPQFITHAGAPDATVLANKNSLCTDVTNSQLYINSGTATVPVWKEFTRAT